MKTRKVPFDIYIPATEHREAIKVDTIRIDVYTDDFGSEMVTPASTQLIEKTQARYMGLLAGSDIRALRERHSLSQDQLSELLGCGKKSLSRWENGREYPSQLVNTLLRLLEDGKVTPEDLHSVRQPRLTAPQETPLTTAKSTRKFPHADTRELAVREDPTPYRATRSKKRPES
jgi:DNA-binding transcriptional regulator YiaG